MKIISIVGARPQFIKSAIISKYLRKYHNEIIIHTGQHYNKELSDIFFNQLKIPEPNYNLGIGSGSHGYQTGNMLIKIEEVMIKEKPDFVLIYGDTNSTVSAILASSKLKIPSGHVEAGLRNFDLAIPEEINRIVTDHLATLLFAPTKTAVFNLRKEGLVNNVFLTGDVMFDMLLQNIEIAKEKSNILNELNLKEKEYILATIHRPENTDIPHNLSNIFNAFRSSKEKIVIPLHPRTIKESKKNSIDIKSFNNLIIIKPKGYLDFLKLLINAKKVITDSGGVQKEAYLLKIPCITIYDSTSWVETVKDGWNILVKAEKGGIINAINSFNPNGKQGNYFGDGNSSIEIVELINKFLKNNI
jgi:UDP-N-acetylglucosamine 2-epimerase